MCEEFGPLFSFAFCIDGFFLLYEVGDVFSSCLRWTRRSPFSGSNNPFSPRLYLLSFPSFFPRRNVAPDPFTEREVDPFFRPPSSVPASPFSWKRAVRPRFFSAAFPFFCEVGRAVFFLFFFPLLRFQVWTEFTFSESFLDQRGYSFRPFPVNAWKSLSPQ